MRRAVVISALALAVVVGGFAMVPAEQPMYRYVSTAKAGDPPDPFDGVYGERKSGLRLAVEGRLTWLGVL